MIGLLAGGITYVVITKKISPALANHLTASVATIFIQNDNFAVLAGSGIVSTNPPQVIVGSVGSSPTFTNGVTAIEVTGTNYIAASPIVDQAKLDLAAAYIFAASEPTTADLTGLDLGTQNLIAGVYNYNTSAQLTGTLILDGQGDPNAVFIFKIGSTLTTAAAGTVSLINGAQACNVFWQVGSSATLGTGTQFVGNILSLTSITDNGGSTINGRLLARNGAVTLNNSTVTKQNCAVVPSANITLIKTVINDNGGSKIISDFPLFIGLLSATSSIMATVTPAIYTMSETNVGYTPSVWGGDCNAAGVVTLANGDVKTCTITNDDTPPLLTLIKTITNDNGGSALPTAWTLNAVGTGGAPTNLSGVTTIFSGATFRADTYTLSETGGPSGYAASLFSCVKNGAPAVASNTIVLDVGDIAVCTINNNDNPPPASISSGGGGSGTYVPAPLINVLKVPSPLALPNGPGLVTYTYTVTNIGEVDINTVTVADNTCTLVKFISGDTNNDAILQVKETWIYTCAVMVDKTTKNIVTATGRTSVFTAIDTAEALVVVGASVVPPLIHIVKVPDQLVLLAPGKVVYKYSVTNPGTVALGDVSITDDKCTGLPARVIGHPGDVNRNDLLEPSETWSFTCSSYLTNTTTNTATVTGHANNLSVTDIAYATVVVVQPTVTPATITPKLPNTGIGPDYNTTIWNSISVGLIISLFLLYKARTKEQKSN